MVNYDGLLFFGAIALIGTLTMALCVVPQLWRWSKEPTPPPQVQTRARAMRRTLHALTSVCQLTLADKWKAIDGSSCDDSYLSEVARRFGITPKQVQAACEQKSLELLKEPLELDSETHGSAGSTEMQPLYPQLTVCFCLRCALHCGFQRPDSMFDDGLACGIRTGRHAC